MVQDDVAPEEAWYLPALEEELTNDPKAVGYAGMDKFQAAAALNEVGLTDDTEPDHAVPATTILCEMGVASLDALGEHRKTMDMLLMSDGSLDLHNEKMWAFIVDVCNADVGACARVEALKMKPCSRAVALDYGEPPEGLQAPILIAFCDVARALTTFIYETDTADVYTAIGPESLGALSTEDRDLLDGLLVFSSVNLWDNDLWTALVELFVGDEGALNRIAALKMIQRAGL